MISKGMDNIFEILRCYEIIVGFGNCIMRFSGCVGFEYFLLRNEMNRRGISIGLDVEHRIDFLIGIVVGLYYYFFVDFVVENRNYFFGIGVEKCYLEHIVYFFESCQVIRTIPLTLTKHTLLNTIDSTDSIPTLVAY